MTESTEKMLTLELEQIFKRSEFVGQIFSAQTVGARFDAIRSFYRALWPCMKATPRERWAMDIYEIDWPRLFTPIEAALWSDIRAEGVVLYPQHPVAGYFVDFGHPIAKVAIECDGEQFHQDKTKDAARQAAIEAQGWTVYRLTGRACFSDDVEAEDEFTGEPIVEPSYSRTLVREIGQQHGLSARREPRA